LREDPENKKTAENQGKFLRYLNECKFIKGEESSFFIKKDQAAGFLVRFARNNCKLEKFL
jgi:hypothetical protein